MRQRTNTTNPALVHTPQGFKRLKKHEPLKEGDLFLHCGLFRWLPVNLTVIKENHYTNCVRPVKPIALLPENCPK